MKKFKDFLIEKELVEIYGFEFQDINEDIKKDYENLKKFFGFLRDNYGHITVNDIKTISYTIIEKTKTMILQYKEIVKTIKEKEIEEKLDIGLAFLDKYLNHYDAKSLEPDTMIKQLPKTVPYKTIELAYGRS